MSHDTLGVKMSVDQSSLIPVPLETRRPIINFTSTLKTGIENQTDGDPFANGSVHNWMDENILTINLLYIKYYIIIYIIYLMMSG